MAISTLGVCIALAAATTAPAARGPVADLARGFLALRAGDFHESARALDGLPQRLPRNRDYALYLLGESLFYDGSYAKARAAFFRAGQAAAFALRCYRGLARSGLPVDAGPAQRCR